MTDHGAAAADVRLALVFPALAPHRGNAEELGGRGAAERPELVEVGREDGEGEQADAFLGAEGLDARVDGRALGEEGLNLPLEFLDLGLDEGDLPPGEGRGLLALRRVLYWPRSSASWTRSPTIS